MVELNNSQRKTETWSIGEAKSPTSSGVAKSTRRLLADMEKAKKRLLSKGAVKQSEVDTNMR